MPVWQGAHSFFQKCDIVETMRQEAICIGWNPVWKFEKTLKKLRTVAEAECLRKVEGNIFFIFFSCFSPEQISRFTCWSNWSRADTCISCFVTSLRSFPPNLLITWYEKLEKSLIVLSCFIYNFSPGVEKRASSLLPLFDHLFISWDEHSNSIDLRTVSIRARCYSPTGLVAMLQCSTAVVSFWPQP